MEIIPTFRAVENDMALNIRDAEVHRLAKELAVLTGETQTQAVRCALEERIDRLRKAREGRLDRLRALAHESAELWKEPYKSMSQKELDDMLYDERGLPK